MWFLRSSASISQRNLNRFLNGPAATLSPSKPLEFPVRPYLQNTRVCNVDLMQLQVRKLQVRKVKWMQESLLAVRAATLEAF